jgi:hypothetical protein
MRREPDFFGDVELELLFMARRLRDALKVEELLTQSGLDYVVETDTYLGGFLFKRELTGAFFYVLPPDIDRAREVVRGNRMKPYAGTAG